MDQDSASCAYCYSRGATCDGTVPRCLTCRQFGILCCATPSTFTSALTSAAATSSASSFLVQDGALAYHSAFAEIFHLETALRHTIDTVKDAQDKQDSWETLLATQPPAFPMGSVPMATVFGMPEVVSSIPPFQSPLAAEDIIRGYMGEFVNGTLARYPLVSPEKVIGLSERFSGVLASVYATGDIETYREVLKANPQDVILFLLIVALGSVLETQRGAMAGTGGMYGELAVEDLGWAPVAGLGFLVEAVNAMQSRSLKFYKSMKAWQVRAWFLVATYYSSIGMMESARQMAKKAAGMMMKIIAKTPSSGFKEASVDGEIVMLYWSLLHFQIDIQSPLDVRSSSCLAAAVTRIPIPSYRYAASRGYIPAYGFTPYTIVMFRDQIRSTQRHLDALVSPTTLETLSEREAAFMTPIETLLDGTVPDMPVSSNEKTACGMATYRRSAVEVEVYRPLMAAALMGEFSGARDVVEEAVFQGIHAMYQCMSAEEAVWGAWSVFGQSLDNLLVMTQVCENLDLRCPVHADTVQDLSDRLSLHLSSVSPSATTLRLSEHPQLRQY